MPIDFTSDDIDDMQPEDYVDFTSPLSNSSTPRQELPQTTVVQGKLASCIDFWKNTIHAPESVLSILQNGYVLPLKNEPTQRIMKNHRICDKYYDFVDDSVRELLAGNCIEQVV